MWQIGSYNISSRVVLAPMAGVSDLPFRQLCRQFGAGLAASEMLISDSRLWDSGKGKWRLAGLLGETGPRVVQIAGSEPAMMAAAARASVDRGAQIVDINMGCPAKKVCRQAAGSALLRDEPLVAAILQAVVAAVPVPVTLKLRTGWCPDSRNAVAIGQLAEKTGIQSITLHGRTRACGYHAPAEYDTIAELVSRVNIPVVANGDISTPEQARQVLDDTGAAAVMVGRAAHGQPWLVRDMVHYLNCGERIPSMSITEKYTTVLQHIAAIHMFYGDAQGVKMARKHVAWYGQHLDFPVDWRREFNDALLASQQVAALEKIMGKSNRKETVEVMAA
jgi:tRNA-dihydrouridine synthase B